MKVFIELKKTARPLEIDNVKNTYQKGLMFCVELEDGTVEKFPLIGFWRVTEKPS